MNKGIFVFLAFVWMAACSPSANENRLPDGVGIMLSNRDTTVRAGDDFFRFVNGGWLSRTVIPPDRGTWGSFNEVQEHNNKILLQALNKAAESQLYQEGTDQRKATDFYQIGMDSLLAEKTGIRPLKPILAAIEKITGKAELQNFLVEEDLMAGDAFFNMSVAPDLKNSQKAVTYLGSGGIGLPERDYYLKPDAKSKETRDQYKQHIAGMLILAGWDGAKARKSAERILILETELANATLTKENKRDPARQYNKKAMNELSDLAPSIRWPVYFNALGIQEDSLIVTEPAFLMACEKVVKTFTLDDLKAYLRWTVVRAAAPFLNHGFVKESFDFNAKYLLGAKQIRPRWERVLNVSDNYLGEAMGRLYVAEVFPPEAKKRAEYMVENIKFAFANRIKQLDWMSDSTKEMALKKLSAFTVKIGYPDKWKNFTGLIIDKIGENSSYYGNILNASKYQVQEQIHRLGKPVDKTDWAMTPQTVNAYYNPRFNEVVFPAGILQPPFYDYRADEAVNYGGIGSIIGHEISHGFDDQGSQFDASGNLNNWWSQEDLRKFKEKGKLLAAQFNKYQPLPGIFVQGQFTLGENIGDLGGVNVAYEGLRRFFRETNQKPSLIDGLTTEQRFFMSWASIWRAKYRDEALRTLILTDVHSPENYRANGPLSNMQEFYNAFGVKKGDKMYRDEKDRLRIW